MKASASIGNTSFNFKDEKMCFTSSSEHIINIHSPIVLCNEILKSICDDIKKCTKEKANFSKAKNLIFNFKSKQLEFSPQEYLYFDKDENVKCDFGSTFLIRGIGECLPDT